MRSSIIFVISILTLLLSTKTYLNSYTISPKSKRFENTHKKNISQITKSDKSVWLTLKDNEYYSDVKTDLLIHFNKEDKVHVEEGLDDEELGSSFAHGNYSAGIKRLQYSQEHKVYGSSSGKFSYESQIELIPKEESLFEQETTGDFTIEFWASPALLSDGETILKRHGPVIENGVVNKYKGIICYIKNRKIFFDFHNIFYSPNIEKGKQKSKDKVSLGGQKRLYKFEWIHHAITYRSLDGKLTYYRNGDEESSIFVTESGQPEDTVLIPRFNGQEKLPLTIGKGYYGYLDELKISKQTKYPKAQILKLASFSDSDFVGVSSSLEDSEKQNIEKNIWQDKAYFHVSPYGKVQGHLVSNIYDLEYKGTYLNDYTISSQQNNKSYIRLQYRLSDILYSTDNMTIPWHDLDHDLDKNTKKTNIAKVQGRYFQWRATFKSSHDGQNTPILKDLSFDFKRDLPPKPPRGLRAYSKDRIVKLLWAGNLEKDILYYKIYYGTDTGNYVQTGPPKVVLSNESQLSLEIDSLEVGRLYFFTVSAVDKNGHESPNSKEVSVIVKK